MNKPQSKTNDASKQRRFQFGIGCFIVLLALPFVFYYGYCWGLWGRHSLLLQYYFQCNCPAASEQARYPKEVEVIVSACHESRVKLSPNGRLLFVEEGNSRYVLNLQTREKTDVSHQYYSIFLTDDVGFIQYPKSYIVDRITGMVYPIQMFRFSRPDAQVNRNINLPLLAESLKQANSVYFIADEDVIVALAFDFRANPKHNFYTNRFDLPDSRMEQFLQENNITYSTIPPTYPDEVTSPDKRFKANKDGIFLVETNQRIVKAPISSVRGWVYDGSGVIYSTSSRCLIHGFLPLADDTWCEVDVPQPVLLLRVPKEYLSTTPMP